MVTVMWIVLIYPALRRMPSSSSVEESVVRPDRFELPAFWFVASYPGMINNLEGLLPFVKFSEKLLCANGFRVLDSTDVARRSNASKHRVGILLGIVGHHFPAAAPGWLRRDRWIEVLQILNG